MKNKKYKNLIFKIYMNVRIFIKLIILKFRKSFAYFKRSVLFFFRLMKESYKNFLNHKTQWSTAAFAYYTILSIAPFSILIAVFISFLPENNNYIKLLVDTLKEYAGNDVATVLTTVITNAREFKQRFTATVLSSIIIIFSSSISINYLKNVFNNIMEVKYSSKVVLHALRKRLLSILIILGIALLIIIYLIVYPLINSIVLNINLICIPVKNTSISVFYSFLKSIIKFIILCFIFFIIYIFIPDKKLPIKFILSGSILTSIFFKAGQFLLNLYLSKSLISSLYGVAGSLVILLLWIYYISQILFFGAEFIYLFYKQSEKKLKK